MFTRRVAGEELCGKTAIACGRLWIGSDGRAEVRKMGEVCPQLGQRSVMVAMWCEQLVPSLCVEAIDSGQARSGGVPMSYPQLGRTWGRAGLVGSVVQVGRRESDGPRLGLDTAG